MSFDPLSYKKDFPIFQQLYNGKPLVYLDNAATTQKPSQVVNAIQNFYYTRNAAVGRSVHFLSDMAEESYTAARATVATFIGATFDELVFTKNSTEALNLCALGWGRHHVHAGDVIVATTLEHNSSLMPWQILAREVGAQVILLNVDLEGNLEPNWRSKFSVKVKVVLLTHVSNVLGVTLPIKALSEQAHKFGAVVVVDGSQAVGHLPVNVAKLACDFYAFSGHKMLGPAGIGVLWGSKRRLTELVPVFFGGGVSLNVADFETEFRDIPWRFESGTPNVEGAVGLAAACDYLSTIDIQDLAQHYNQLCDLTLAGLSQLPGVVILGPKTCDHRGALVSFYVKDVHAHDISALLSQNAIAVRSGLHCAMAVYNHLTIPAAVRVSFSVYTTKADITKFLTALAEALAVLKR